MANVSSMDTMVQMTFLSGDPIELTDTLTFKTSEQLAFQFRTVHERDSFFFFLYDAEQELVRSEDAVLASGVPILFISSLKKGVYNLQLCRKTESMPVQSTGIVLHVRSSALDHWTFFILLGLYLLLLLGGAVYIIFLSNRRGREKLVDLRSDWTNKLHNDIGGDLSSVSIRLDLIKLQLRAKDANVSQGVEKTFQVLRGIQKKLRFVFNLVDPKKDSLKVMLADVIDFAKDNAELLDMKVNVVDQLPEKLDHKIDIGRVNKLYLALKEVVNNVLKSSQASQLDFTIDSNRQGLKVIIQDDGIGFDLLAKHEGNGLENLRQYARDGLIELQIKTKPGQGTLVRMDIPFL